MFLSRPRSHQRFTLFQVGAEERRVWGALVQVVVALYFLYFALQCETAAKMVR